MGPLVIIGLSDSWARGVKLGEPHGDPVPTRWTWKYQDVAFTQCTVHLQNLMSHGKTLIDRLFESIKAHTHTYILRPNAHS